MRLKLRIKLMRLLASVLALREAILDRAVEHADTIMPAYTHWQQSQIMTVGHFLGRFSAWLERDTQRLFECVSRHNLSVLGSANGVGTSVRVDRAMTAAWLGHDEPTLSTGDGTNAWDYMIEPVSVAALLCSHLARLTGNFILWHTQEFGMVRLSDAFCTASTYLPHKRNPEPLETVKVFAEQVQGALATVYLMARNEDWPHSLINHGFDAINGALTLSGDAADLTGAIMRDISFDPARMREAAGPELCHGVGSGQHAGGGRRPAVSGGARDRRHGGTRLHGGRTGCAHAGAGARRGPRHGHRPAADRRCAAGCLHRSGQFRAGHPFQRRDGARGGAPRARRVAGRAARGPARVAAVAGPLRRGGPRIAGERARRA